MASLVPRPLCAATLLFSSSLLVLPATATPLYRCTDAHGGIIWQQRPCSDGASFHIPPTPNRSTESVTPLRDPLVRQELDRIDAEIAALNRERQQLRTELEERLRKLTAALPDGGGRSERERLTSERARTEQIKEQERRYRSELRLIEKRLEQLGKERQLLLRAAPYSERKRQ